MGRFILKWFKININDVTEKEYKEFLALLSDERKERIERFKSFNDKKRSVCGEALAKTEIAKICEKRADELIFETKKSGKPFCKNADIEFSISHSGDYSVCAVNNTPIGIDIQKIVPYNEKIARRVCSSNELEIIEKSIFSSEIKNCLENKTVKTIEFSDYIVSICE